MWRKMTFRINETNDGYLEYNMNGSDEEDTIQNRYIKCVKAWID